MKLPQILNAANILTIAIIGFFIVRYMFEKLTVFEAFTIVVLPLALSLSTYYSSKVLMDERQRELMSAIDQKMTSYIQAASKDSALFHGPKIAIPNQSAFWNGLLRDAKQRFLICSNTNKSWFDKSAEQSAAVAARIVDLIDSGGTVTVISQDLPYVREFTDRFIVNFLKPEIAKMGARRKASFKPEFEKRFEYYSHSGCRYTAALSDERLLLIPSMNTDQFKEESVVFELNRNIHTSAFNNFVADIERLKIYGAKRNDVASTIFG